MSANIMRRKAVYARAIAVLIGVGICILCAENIGDQPIAKAGLKQYFFFITFGLFSLLLLWGMFDIPDNKADSLKYRLFDVFPTALASSLMIAYLASASALHYLWGAMIIGGLALVLALLKKITVALVGIGLR